MSNLLKGRNGPCLIALFLVLLAFAARTWQLETVPPGWSDDELSNIFVISQKVFQGDTSLYYPDATGLEAPYHVASGLFLTLFGFNAIGIRLLSVFLGTLTVPLTYVVGSRLFDRRTGLLAAAMLAVSFWSLVYSRVNLRHILLPVLLLLTFYFFWRGVRRSGNAQASERTGIINWSRVAPSFLWAGLCMGLGFYTYFASRGVPLIILAFVLYLALFYRARLRRLWPGLLFIFLLAALLALPLLFTLQQLPGADARVAEVAVPVVAAREGDYEPLLRHIVITLSMFHGNGDDEFLYNIPHRPVFGPVGALFFWAGVLIAAWLALQPLLRRNGGRRDVEEPYSLAAAFLLLWWLAGISPGFLSVPPASLGHTIVAQPAAYLLAALPLWFAGRILPQRWNSPTARRWRTPLLALAALLLWSSVALRDFNDYFNRWPERGMTRFLYHADMKDVADYVAQRPEVEHFAISGLLAGPWDRLALQVDLQNVGRGDMLPRWYDPRRAIFLELAAEPALLFSGYPRVENVYEALLAPLPNASAGDYRVALAVDDTPDMGTMPETCFRNGLCLVAATFEAQTGRLDLTWRVGQTLDLPPQPLLSKPPPPGTDDGPRLLVFAHLLDGSGQRVDGDDGLWVDATTLQSGDLFRQQHWLLATDEGTMEYRLSVGLYNPVSGERILTTDGRDQLQLDVR